MLDIPIEARFNFGIKAKAYYPPSTSVYDMVMDLTGGILENATVQIKNPDGSMVVWSDLPQHMWKFVKCKLGDSLRIFTKPAGGDNSIFAAIAMIVVAVIAPFLVGTVLGLTAGSFAYIAATAAIQIGGALAFSALFPPPTPPANTSNAAKSDSDSQKLANVKTDSNPMAINSRLAWVLGYRRVTLFDVCQPHLYLENGRQVIIRVMALADHHEISDLELNDVPIDDITDIEYEITSGAEGVATQKLVNRIADILPINKSFTGFMSKENNSKLVDQIKPENSEPKPIVFSTIKPKNPVKINKLAEIAIRFRISGLLDSDSLSGRAIQPVRISFWTKSNPETKFKLPEMHIAARKVGEVLKEFKFRWDDNFSPPAPSSDVDFNFYTAPATGDWVADDHFVKTGGGVKNIDRTVDGLNIKLDEEIYPKDEYEFEILGGQPIVQSNFNGGSYLLHGQVRNLFKARLSSNIYYLPSPDKSASSNLVLQFVATVIDEPPIQTPNIASVAVISKNNDVERITAKAGKVIDLRGDVSNPWIMQGATSNPADCARYILKKWSEKFRFDFRLIHDQDFVDWSVECENKGYTTSFPASGQTTAEVFKLMCAAGFATPTYDMNGFGVTYFRNTSQEPALMHFDARNCESIVINKIDTETPAAYRITYENKENNWTKQTDNINNEFGKSPIGGDLLINYPSIDDSKQIRKRALFDMLQGYHRYKHYIIKSGVAAHSLKKGDLIGVSTDLISEFAHGFRIDHVINKNTLAVDRAIEVEGDVESNLLDVENLLAEGDLSIVGGDSVVSILTPNGLEEHDIDRVHGNLITLKTDIQYSKINELEQTHISVASKSERYNRVIVLDVAREDGNKAVLTCVDEACEIWRELERRFG